jgi:hypothetical protein
MVLTGIEYIPLFRSTVLVLNIYVICVDMRG